MTLYRYGDLTPDLPEDGDVWIAPGAHVIGNVTLESGVSVWFGSVLRGDNEWIEVGTRSQVQDNSTLHTDPGFPLTIGCGVTVGHAAILHGCTIEDDVLVTRGDPDVLSRDAPKTIDEIEAIMAS